MLREFIRYNLKRLFEAMCPDCRGSGEYVGFRSREKCKTCGGSGDDSGSTINNSREVAIEWDFKDTEFEELDYLSAIETAGLPETITIPQLVIDGGDEQITRWVNQTSEDYGFYNIGFDYV